MKRYLSLLSALVLLVGSLGAAQAAPAGDDVGQAGMAHPWFHLSNRPSSSTPQGYSPTQIRHAYGFDQISSTGAGAIIGIVDAYDAPTIASDLQTFDTTLGVAAMNGLPGTPSCTVQAGPHPCFQKVYAASTKPRANASWGQEISLDVEWSHAIAPGADVLLVETASSGNASLLRGVDTAVKDGAKVVSMSWGGAESSLETSNDSHFNHAGVTFVTSAGDSGSKASWPSASPDVVTVGGTTLNLDSSNNVTSETVWSGSGGGISAYETEPGYQSSYPIPNTNGKRGIPDVSYVANPSTGVGIYDSTASGGYVNWFTIGGTSVGAPQWSGLIALVDQTRAAGALSSNNLTSSPEYNAAASAVYATNFRDITSGTNGSCGAVCTAGTGYDFVTGVGSPLANSLVSYLASH